MIAVGPSIAQVKPLANVPATDKPAVIDAIVREAPQLFFIEGDSALVAGGAWLSSSGEWWAAAMDAHIVTELILECRRARLHVKGFVAAASVLHRAFSTPDFVWQDGNTTVSVTHPNGTIAVVRRRGSSPEPQANFVKGLAGHPCPLSIADAWAAALSRRGDAPMLKLDSRRKRRRHAFAASALAVSAVTAAFLPFLRTTIPSNRLQTELNELRAGADSVSALRVRLDRVTAVLTGARDFDRQRISTAALMADVSHAIGSAAQVESFTFEANDPLVITFVSYQTPPMLTSLAHIRGVKSVTAVGPIERDQSTGRALQRVTVRIELDATRRRTTDDL